MNRASRRGQIFVGFAFLLCDKDALVQQRVDAKLVECKYALKHKKVSFEEAVVHKCRFEADWFPSTGQRMAVETCETARLTNENNYNC